MVRRMPQHTRWGDGGAMECLANDVGIVREMILTVITNDRKIEIGDGDLHTIL